MFNKHIHKRIKIILLIIIFCFIIIICKVFYIQVIDYDKLNNYATNLWSRNLVIGANRGRILTNDNVTKRYVVFFPCVVFHNYLIFV